MSNKSKAQTAVQLAVKRGDLPRIRSQRCVGCGGTAVSYHHHKGYSKANWLNVVPLCGICHGKEHSPTNPSNKLTAENVKAAKEMKQRWYTIQDIANKFGVGKSTITNAVNSRSYRWVK
jgi:hypothetical protein